jgi:hypothetical protein
MRPHAPMLVPGLCPGPASHACADEVFLKGGGRISGQILSRTEDSVAVNVGAGIITVPMSSVLRIEEKRSVLDDYDERVAALRADRASDWLELAKWAASQGLGTQARRAYEKVVASIAEHRRGPGAVLLTVALGDGQEATGPWATCPSRASGYRPPSGMPSFASATPLGRRSSRGSMRNGAREMPRPAQPQPRRVHAKRKPRRPGTRWSSRTGGARGVKCRRNAITRAGRHRDPRWAAGLPADYAWLSQPLGVWPSQTLGVWPSQTLGVWPSSPPVKRSGPKATPPPGGSPSGPPARPPTRPRPR